MGHVFELKAFRVRLSSDISALSQFRGLQFRANRDSRGSFTLDLTVFIRLTLMRYHRLNRAKSLFLSRILVLNPVILLYAHFDVETIQFVRRLLGHGDLDTINVLS